MPQPALEFDAVSFAYPGAAHAAAALSRISLRVDEGERLGVLGPNGGGKSTLLRIALGLLPGYTGRVSVFGMAPDLARKRGLIGYLPQRSEAELAFPISVRQAVLSAASWRVPPWKPAPRDLRERADRAIDLVGASAYADRPVGSLSGGQLQRALIARAIACGARLLALDEPMVGVDAGGQRIFADMLATLHARLGLTIVIVSHDIRSIAAGCDRVACLARTLHFHDSPKGLTPQVLAEVFSHDMAGIFGELHIDAHAADACDHGPGAHHYHHTGGGVVPAAAPERAG